jgi:predicted Zn-dependent protease
MSRHRCFVCLYFFFLFWFLTSSSAGEQAVDHDAAMAAYRSGNTMFDGGRFAEAAAAYQRAVELDPQYAPAYHNLALADEMVDRQKALTAWQGFAAVAEKNPDMKFDVTRAEIRQQLLQTMPTLPEGMQPSRYVSGAGDYYWDVATEAEERLWKTFPVKVDLGSAPQAKWAQGTAEAFNIWKAVFPLQLVTQPDEADIRVSWIQEPYEDNAAGEESDRPRWEWVGGAVKEREVCTISVALAGHNWTKDEMRAIMLHEMGHAIGIKEHSSSEGDIMYYRVQEKAHQVYLPDVPYPIRWRSVVKQPSQRDLNTLIRLYNTPGMAKRMP